MTFVFHKKKFELAPNYCLVDSFFNFVKNPPLLKNKIST